VLHATESGSQIRIYTLGGLVLRTIENNKTGKRTSNAIRLFNCPSPHYSLTYSTRIFYTTPSCRRQPDPHEYYQTQHIHERARAINILFVNEGPGLTLGSMWDDYAGLEEIGKGHVLVATLKMLESRLSKEWLLK
jgi:hypothetical protein